MTSPTAPGFEGDEAFRGDNAESDHQSRAVHPSNVVSKEKLSLAAGKVSWSMTPYRLPFLVWPRGRRWLTVASASPAADSRTRGGPLVVII